MKANISVQVYKTVSDMNFLMEVGGVRQAKICQLYAVSMIPTFLPFATVWSSSFLFLFITGPYRQGLEAEWQVLLQARQWQDVLPALHHTM